MRLSLFFVFLNFGLAGLIGGLLLTRKAWRPDIPPFGRGSRPFQIALHPERYAVAAQVGRIRALNIVGAILILCALGVVVYDIAVGVSTGG